MKRALIFTVIILAGGVSLSPLASGQKFAIKAYDNIGLGHPMQISNSQPGQNSKSNYNAFGVDFGYTFWRHAGSSLEVNAGVGYSMATATFSIPDMKYHYAAPAIADEDGNPYERYYELSNLRQNSTLGYINIPIYLEYQYRPISWMGLHAEVGVGLGFRTNGSAGSMGGNAYAYGIFPEYDDLLIDEAYLDDFGNRTLHGAAHAPQSMKGFAASIMCGAGFEFYAYEPVSFEVGVRYNAALTNAFNGKFNVANPGEFTADNAPVTYTVAEGTQVRALADYTTKSRLSPLSLHVGINVRF